MGNFQSIPSRAERRRANRLSKPLTNNACLSPISTISSPPAVSQVNPPASPRPAPWKDPWNGSSIPASPSVADGDRRLPQPLPSTTPQIRAPRPRVPWNARSDSIAEESQGGDYYGIPSSVSTTPSINRRPSFQASRRASYHPDAWRSSSLSSSPRQPIRTYSLQSTPQGTDSTIYENELEDATSSNTYFMVNNQRFSVTRRRSLLTRPGVATRRSSKQSVRGSLPPADQGPVKAPSNRAEKARSMQLPLPESEDMSVRHSFLAAVTRPDTPNDFQYTHLGALKLGSLRVVNGSTSPCPSDRSKMPCDSSEDLRPTALPGSDHVKDSIKKEPTLDRPLGQETGHRATSEDTSVLASSEQSNSAPKISSVSDSKGQVEIPTSPLSFEKSPTMTTLPTHVSFFGQGEEGANEERSTENGARIQRRSAGGPNGKKPSKPLAKADSGYSSATSTHSSREVARASLDSQQMNRHSWDSCKLSTRGGSENCEKLDVRRLSGSNNEIPIQRHRSLKDSKVSVYSSSFDSYSSNSEPQSVQPDGHSRPFSLAVPGGLRRAVSSARPCLPFNGLNFVVPSSEMLLSHQAQQSDVNKRQSSHSHVNGYGTRPPGLKVSHRKSMSTPSLGEQKSSYKMEMPTPRDWYQFGAGAPCYNSFSYRRLQRQNTRKLVAEGKSQERIGAGMTTEQFLQSKDELSIETWLESPGMESSFSESPSMGQMETVEEKESVTTHENPDESQIEDLDNCQREKAPRPRKQQNLYVPTSPFIFH